MVRDEASFAAGIAWTLGLFVQLYGDLVSLEDVLKELGGNGYGLDRLKALGADDYDLDLVRKKLRD